MVAPPLSSAFLPSPSDRRTDILRAASCDERGLVIGAGTRLVRRAAPDRLTVEADAARCLALLSVLSRKSLGPDILRPIEAAAAYWAAGDKALANLRLVFSRLPKLRSIADADRLTAAAWCLDQGLAPRDLMKALDLDPSVLDLRKYDPDQPRVPAGSGRESGRWTDGTDAAVSEGRSVSTDTPHDEVSRKPHIVSVVDDGHLKPGGINVVPHPDLDPLDPSRFNGPLSLAEQQAIADTVDTIEAGDPADLSTLNPHPYKNRPDDLTGAVLPPPTGGYTTYYMRASGAPPGKQRIIMDQGGHIFYTRNHYLSFYPVDIKIVPRK